MIFKTKIDGFAKNTSADDLIGFSANAYALAPIIDSQLYVVAAYLPHPILLPEGEGIQFTLSLRERVARGRVRGPHSSAYATPCIWSFLLCHRTAEYL
jgi:hypothetical protein